MSDKSYSKFTDTKLTPEPRKEGYSAVDLVNEGLLRGTAICPKCHNTCIKQKRTGLYFCDKCDIPYIQEQVIDARQ